MIDQEIIERLARIETHQIHIMKSIDSLPCSKHQEDIADLRLADEKANTALARSKLSI